MRIENRIDLAIKNYSHNRAQACEIASKVTLFIAVSGFFSLMILSNFVPVPKWVRFGIGLAAPIPFGLIGMALHARATERKAINNQVIESKQIHSLKLPLSAGEAKRDPRLKSSYLFGISKKVPPTAKDLLDVVNRYDLEASPLSITSKFHEEDSTFFSKLKDKIEENKLKNLNRENFIKYNEKVQEYQREALYSAPTIFSHLGFKYRNFEYRDLTELQKEYLERRSLRLRLALDELSQCCREGINSGKNFLPDPYTRISRFLYRERFEATSIEQAAYYLERSIYEAHLLKEHLKSWQTTIWEVRTRSMKDFLHELEVEEKRGILKTLYQSMQKKAVGKCYKELAQKIDPAGFEKIKEKDDPIYFRLLLDANVEKYSLETLYQIVGKEDKRDFKAIAKRFGHTSLCQPFAICHQELTEIEGKLRSSQTEDEYNLALEELTTFTQGPVRLLRDFIELKGRLSRFARLKNVRQKRTLATPQGTYILSDDDLSVKQIKNMKKRLFKHLQHLDNKIVHAHLLQCTLPLIFGILLAISLLLKNRVTLILSSAALPVNLGSFLVSSRYMDRLLQKKKILQLKESFWASGSRRPVLGEAADTIQRKCDALGLDGGDLSLLTTVVTKRARPNPWRRSRVSLWFQQI